MSTWKPYRIRELERFLSERDVELLERLEQFRLLSTRQLQRLLFGVVPLGPHQTQSAGTRAAARALTRLEKRGVVVRLERRIGGPEHGSAAAVWQLAASGERYLRARRGDPDRRQFSEPGEGFVAHTLAIVDVALELIEGARAGHFEMLDLETEPRTWRRFSGTGATSLTLKPDLLVVSADRTTETHSFVEVDRGTEHFPAVLRKCRVYARYAASGSEERRRGLFPAVVWITTTDRRAQNMRLAIDGDPGLPRGPSTVTTFASATPVLAPYNSTESSTLKGGTT